MSERSLLEKKHYLLREMLHENLDKKHAMEINIRQQLEELKTVEIRLGKMQVAQDNASTAMACASWNSGERDQ
jgi:hypothetical protein